MLFYRKLMKKRASWRVLCGDRGIAAE